MPSTLENQHDIARFLDLLRCPQSQQALSLESDSLVSASGNHRYRVNAAGIPLFAAEFLSAEAKIQRHHYDRIAAAYMANLEYPHTREYLSYLDRVTLAASSDQPLGTVAELCCGRGEAPSLFGDRIRRYVGVDVSENMLQAAIAQHTLTDGIFIQGDATNVPLAAESVDTVIIDRKSVV